MKRSALKIVVAALMVCSMFALCACEKSEPYVAPKKDPAIDSSLLVTADTLTVGVNASSAPFAQDHNGKIEGLDVDIAAAMADNMGLSLKIVDVADNPSAAVKDGTVDIVMGLDAVESYSGISKSDIYLESASAIFAKQKVTDIPEKKNGGKKIVAGTASMSAWCVLEQFGAKQLKSMDLLEGFEAVSKGKYSYCAADAVVGMYISNVSNYKFHIVALLENPSGYVIGVKKSNKDLLKAVNEAASGVVSSGMVDVVEGRWLGEPLHLDSIPTTPKAKDARPTSNTTKSSGTVKLKGVGANAVQF